MLVLSRKVGERILIGKDIAVTIVRVTPGGVRVGIEAPTELPVVREELAQQMDGTLTPAPASGPSAPPGNRRAK